MKNGWRPGNSPNAAPSLRTYVRCNNVRHEADRLLLDHGGTHHGLGDLVHDKSDERRGYEDPTRMGQV